MSRFGQIARGLGRFIPADAVRGLARPAALFFHGVAPATIDPKLQVNHHETLDFMQIAQVLKRDFDVLKLDAIDDVMKNPDRHPRAVFLMSDDGYANTLTVAADILEDLALPWSLFVSTHHIDTGERNPVFLARLFAHRAPAGRHAIVHLPEPIVLGEARDVVAEQLVRQLRALDMVRAQQAVDAMMAVFEPATLSDLLETFDSERFLTWDEIRTLHRRGVAIGAHAVRHWPMNASQTADMLREQAAGAKARIEAEIGPCRVFSYPFGNTGDVSPAAWRAVRDAGYDYAFTTLSGSLDAASNPFLLPRYGIEPRAPHLATLISMLRTGNPRVARWQKALSA
jgi:peptidoglycan/xylan/chitin deacetylase (PgdA/CDA1 family)